MAKRKEPPQRRQIVDPAVADLLGNDRRAGGLPRPDSGLTKEQTKMKARKPGRATYDLPPELKAAVADLSIRFGCPQSQLVTLLLIDGIGRIAAGEIDPAGLQTPSDSPKFAYNLDLTAALEKLQKLL